MHGYDGLLPLVTLQTEAFEDFSVEPLEFIDAGTGSWFLCVSVGERRTRACSPFEVVHVCTARDGRWTRLDIYPTESDASKPWGWRSRPGDSVVQGFPRPG
jgi:hypothetical protein